MPKVGVRPISFQHKSQRLVSHFFWRKMCDVICNLPISYVTAYQKSSKKTDSLNHSETYCVINDCDVKRGVSVANPNAKENRSFFFINSRANKIIRHNKAINYSNYTYMKTIPTMQIDLFMTNMLGPSFSGHKWYAI